MHSAARHRLVTALAALLAGSGLVSAAEYRAQRGDVLEVAVYGSPELSRRASLDVDGEVSLPLIGTVPVAGLTVPEIRAKLSALLSEGKIVKVPEVIVDIAEYRPVYVRGDVLSAGAFPYRPGMTVRQVMALVGGSGLKSTGPAAVSPADLADMRAEYTALSTELAMRQAHFDRLRAELDNKGGVEFTPFGGRQVRPEIVSRIKTLETQQLDAVRAGSGKAADHLKVMAGFAADQLGTLDLQRKEVEQSVQLQSDEVDKVKGLFLKGVITSTRLTDEQRALAAAKTQLLSNIAQAGDVRRLRADFDDKIRETADAKQLQNLKDTQQTLVDLEKTRARLVAVGQKLIAAKDNLPLAQTGAADGPSFTIYRSAGEDRARMAVTEDAEVAPGDVVEVRSADSLVPAPAATSDAGGGDALQKMAEH